MKSVVIDGSVALAFLLTDESTPLAFRALDLIQAAPSAHVPNLFWLEVANGLLMAERRGRATLAETTRALQIAADLPLIIDGEPASINAGPTLSLARTYRLTVYDAAYLELALRHRSLLATVDKALHRAAIAAGLEVLK